jgi:hypothetical protein
VSTKSRQAQRAAATCGRDGRPGRTLDGWRQSDSLRTYLTIDALRTAVSESIEVWYQRISIHDSINQLRSMAFDVTLWVRRDHHACLRRYNCNSVTHIHREVLQQTMATHLASDVKRGVLL